MLREQARVREPKEPQKRQNERGGGRKKGGAVPKTGGKGEEKSNLTITLDYV